MFFPSEGSNPTWQGSIKQSYQRECIFKAVLGAKLEFQE